MVNITEAKNNLSKLVVHKPTGERQLGLLTGELVIPASFSNEDEQISDTFYGDDG